MAFSIKELQELRAKLDRDRRELDERERALAKVEEMLREQMIQFEPALAMPSPETLPKPDGLSDAVSMAVAALANKEFAVPDIEEYLVATGFDLPKAEPRSRIAMVLQKLKEASVITRTFEGKGRAPHRYRFSVPNH